MESKNQTAEQEQKVDYDNLDQYRKVLISLLSNSSRED